MSIIDKIEKSERAQKVLASSGTLFVFSMLAPAFFMLSINIHMFYSVTLLDTIIKLCLFTLPMGLLGCIFDKVFEKANSKVLKTILLLLIGLISALIIFQLMFTVKDWISTKIIRDIFRALMYILFAFIVYKFRQKPLNIFLFLFLLLSLFRCMYDGTRNYIADIQIRKELAQNSEDVFERKSLANKPNIYLVYLESYHDPKTMRGEYNIPIHELTDFLEDKNYLVYEDIYSNSHSTLASLFNLYTMISDRKNIERGNSDVVSSVRDIVGGNKDNKLLKFLKKENYYTSIFYASNDSYYLDTNGIYLDNRLNENVYDNNHRLDLISYKLGNIYNSHLDFKIKKNVYVKEEVFYNEIEEILNRQLPSFFLYKCGANHVYTRGHYSFDSDYNKWKNTYYKMVQKSNDEIYFILNTIEKNDPNAIVILLGDHGAWGMLDISIEEAKLRNENDPTFYERYTRSWLGIFLAVKMPDYAKQDISYGLPISPANLFRHVFAALENDESFIENLEPNISIMGKHILVQEGQIIYD